MPPSTFSYRSIGWVRVRAIRTFKGGLLAGPISISRVGTNCKLKFPRKLRNLKSVIGGCGAAQGASIPTGSTGTIDFIFIPRFPGPGEGRGWKGYKYKGVDTPEGSACSHYFT
jgi:hypothetical protein